MTEKRTETALCVLQWTIAIVILIEAVLFVLPGARHDFARMHLPGVLRQILGWGEILGAILLVIPRTAVRGAWILMAVFLFAIAIHLLHGQFNVGNLVVYTAAAWAVAASKSA